MLILVGVAILLALAGTLAYGVILYNELVRLRNDNDRAWANIEVLLKQRHDEIPNLVESVKGYMQHEQGVLTSLTLARSAWTQAATVPQKAQADLMLTGALRGLFAVAENYPNLKADQQFLRLQVGVQAIFAALRLLLVGELASACGCLVVRRRDAVSCRLITARVRGRRHGIRSRFLLAFVLFLKPLDLRLVHRALDGIGRHRALTVHHRLDHLLVREVLDDLASVHVERAERSQVGIESAVANPVRM